MQSQNPVESASATMPTPSSPPADAPPSARELQIRDKLAKGLTRAQAIGIIERQEAHDRPVHVRPRGPLVSASRNGTITRTPVSRAGNVRS